MFKVLIILISALFLIGCVNSGPRPERIITQTVIQYREIPEEFFNCPDVPILTDEEINALIFESEYNEAMVLPREASRDECYQSIQRIYEFNEENKRLNNNEQ